MKYVVKSKEKEYYYYYSTRGGITRQLCFARWFNYRDAKKIKAMMNRKTNPRTVWEVVEYEQEATRQLTH